jgi:aminopeptidase N
MKITIHILIIFICSPFNSVFPQDTYHHKNAQNHFISEGEGSAFSVIYDVLKYRLNVKILPASSSIRASNIIQLRALDNIDNQINLDFSGLETDSVLIDGLTTEFTQNADQLYINLLQTISSGDSAIIEVFYHGQPSKGLYFRTNSYGDTVIYSHNEPYDARYWLPCKDDPFDKAFFELIVSIPEQYIPVSNGVIINETISDDGVRTIEWSESYPIATYLISIAAAPYLVVNQNYTWQQISMPLQYYVYPPDRNLGENGLTSSRNILDFFNVYISDYPFINEKYAMCAVPFREAAAMENQTATTMRDDRIDDEGVIAHELAHQWWGDALTLKNFEHIWLNEGFASYFDAMFTEHQYGLDAFKQHMSAYKSLIFQDGSVDYPILNPPPEFLFGRAVYFKGAWVLHMLRNVVGEQLYKNIIRSYYNLYAYKNADTDDFIQVCQNQSDLNLSRFFDQWLNYGGIPELYGQWQQNKNEVTFYIEQTQSETVYHLQLEIQINGANKDSLIVLPLTSRTETVIFPFSDRISNITIDPDNKILQRNNSPLYIIPTTTTLSRLYPNPFNNQITIEFISDRTQEIMIELWDTLGKRVETIYRGKRATGVHRVIWNGRSNSSATYFVVLRAKNQTDVRKVLLLK